MKTFSPLLTTILLLGLTQTSFAQEKSEADPFAKWDKAISDFEKDDQANPKKPGQVLFIGSSSIRLWKLDKWFPDLGAINRGFGGSEVADAVHFFDRIVTPYKPRTIVMYAGDNDIGKGKSPDQVFSDFKEFVAKTHAALPKTNIIYIAVKPSIKRWNLIENVRATNSLVANLAKSDPLVEFLDIDTPMIGEDGTPRKELFVEDGLHMSDAGYKIWTELLKPHLAKRPSHDARLDPLRTLNDPYHPWVPPTSLAEWEKTAEKIRRQILVSNGLWPLPEKTPLNPVIHGKVDRDDYTVEKVYFASRPGLYVTGNLYRPKNIEGRVPGVLCPHGHWADGRFYDAGNGAAEQISSGAEKYESGAHFPLQARMVQLARMGCVVFHYDMVGYADSQSLDHRTGFNDAQAELWLHNIMGLQTWSSIRALDFLETLPDVDTKRLAVTGASGGGTQTMILAALDPRVAVTFPAVMVSTAMQGGCVCENASYLRQGLNNVAFAAAFAPKPQAMSGADDWTIDIETKGLPELKQIYSLYGKANLVEAHAFPQFKHNYNQVSREVMYNWFNEHLHLGLDGPVIQSDFKPLTREEMSVFDAEHPVPQDAMNAEAMRKSMVAADLKTFSELLKSPQEYQEVVRGAANVMLQPDQSPAEFIAHGTPELLGDASIIHGHVTSADGILIPTVVAVLSKREQNPGTVFWFSSSGTKLLKSEPAIKKLVSAGYAVVTADLFRTGENSGDKPQVNEQFPGYTFGYNRPLISERVRDILAVMDAVPQSKRGEKTFVIGKNGGGVWTSLAIAMSTEHHINKTIVDVEGFTFDVITSPQDENLLPGALKYGGLPGVMRLASGRDVEVHGVKNEELFVSALEPDSTVKVSHESISNSEIADTILSNQ